MVLHLLALGRPRPEEGPVAGHQVGTGGEVLGQQPFALPLACVVEIFNLDPTRTNTVDGQLTVRLRDRALPLFYLRDWLVAATVGDHAGSQSGHVVVVNVGGIQIGLVVDFLIGQEEVVIKPLGALLQGLEGMAGATIRAAKKP